MIISKKKNVKATTRNDDNKSMIEKNESDKNRMETEKNICTTSKYIGNTQPEYFH